LGNKRVRRNHYRVSRQYRWEVRKRFLLVWVRIAAGISAVAVMSGIFIFGYDLATQCDYFRAQEIHVEGARRLSVSEVIAKAGVHEGINALSVNLYKTRKQLLDHPWIAQAEIGLELPSAIRIRIVEEEPLAVVDLGRRYVINTKGEIFKKWEPSDPERLPVVGGLEYSDLAVLDGTCSESFRAVMNVLRLGSDADAVVPVDMVKRIHVDHEMGLTVFAFDRPRMIKLGYERYSEKYDRLRDVMTYLKERPEVSDFESIDLNDPGRIVIAPVPLDCSGKDGKEVKGA